MHQKLVKFKIYDETYENPSKIKALKIKTTDATDTIVIVNKK